MNPLLSFNTEHHHEHHAFPNVAWTRLPRLKAIAPDVFNVESRQPYFRLCWNHMREDFNPRCNSEADLPRFERCEAAPAAVTARTAGVPT